MKADLPYHFCDWLGCGEMVPPVPGALYCAAHHETMISIRALAEADHSEGNPQSPVSPSAAGLLKDTLI